MPGRHRVASRYVGTKMAPQPAAKMDTSTPAFIVLAAYVGTLTPRG